MCRAPCAAAGLSLSALLDMNVGGTCNGSVISGQLILSISSSSARTLAAPKLANAFDDDAKEALGLSTAGAKIATDLPAATSSFVFDTTFNLTLFANANASAAWTYEATNNGLSLRLINATLDCDAKPAAWNTTGVRQGDAPSAVVTGGITGSLTLSDASIVARLPNDKLVTRTNVDVAAREDAALTVVAKGKLGGNLKVTLVDAKAKSLLKATLAVSDGNVFSGGANSLDSNDDGDASARGVLHVFAARNRTIVALTAAVSSINSLRVALDFARSALPWTSVGVNASNVPPVEILGPNKAALNLT